jgi:hypothetical protein
VLDGARYITAAVSLAGFVLTIGYVASGKLAFNFFPVLPGDVVVVQARLPYGAALASTEAVHAELEAALQTTIEEFGADNVRGVFTRVGQAAPQQGPGAGEALVGSHIVAIEVALLPSERRSIHGCRGARLREPKSPTLKRRADAGSSSERPRGHGRQRAMTKRPFHPTVPSVRGVLVLSLALAAGCAGDPNDEDFALRSYGSTTSDDPGTTTFSGSSSSSSSGSVSIPDLDRRDLPWRWDLPPLDLPKLDLPMPDLPGPGGPSPDTDGDGIPDDRDIDDDGDGILDGDEDDDGDGIPNDRDTDDNGDGIHDDDEDSDGDGIPNGQDPDDDNDGTPDANEDSDGDGVPDQWDDDDDGDGIPDVNEDWDGDGIPNGQDPDMDGDGIPNGQEDSDGDGIPDANDPDADGDGVPDLEEDEDGDGIPDHEDDDIDGDGIPDHDEVPQGGYPPSPPMFAGGSSDEGGVGSSDDGGSTGP